MTNFHLTHRQKTLDLQLCRRRIVIGRIGQIHVVFLRQLRKIMALFTFFAANSSVFLIPMETRGLRPRSPNDTDTATATAATLIARASNSNYEMML